MVRQSPQGSFEHRQDQPWILGFSYNIWLEKVVSRVDALEKYKSSHGLPRVLIYHHHPIDLLAGFMACAIAQCPVFLGNPNWKGVERTQASAIANPHLIWSDQGTEYFLDHPYHPTEKGWIMIPTGGTSGQIKFAIHTWLTLSAAVGGVQDFFYGDKPLPLHSCCVLPMYHVSGLMQFMRSLLTGGELVIMPFKTFLAGESSDAHLHHFLSPHAQTNQAFFLSFVPTQLSRFIVACQTQYPERLIWLKHFQAILLGGAPASAALITQARELQLNLAPCYGMTETAAQVMTLHPNEFLAGQSPPGQVLPHVEMTLVHSSSQTHIGQLQWSGSSVYQGYYPKHQDTHHFLTDDIAEWTKTDTLILKGRASRKIISGGENIYPEEIEAILMAMTEVEDVCVFGWPDHDWGEIAIAAYIPTDIDLSSHALQQTIKTQLSAYKCPKIWWVRSSIPRNRQGKVNLNQLKQDWLASPQNKEK